MANSLLLVGHYTLVPNRWRVKSVSRETLARKAGRLLFTVFHVKQSWDYIRSVASRAQRGCWPAPGAGRTPPRPAAELQSPVLGHRLPFETERSRLPVERRPGDS